MERVLGISGLGNKAISVKQIPGGNKFDRLPSGELGAAGDLRGLATDPDRCACGGNRSRSLCGIR